MKINNRKSHRKVNRKHLDKININVAEKGYKTVPEGQRETSQNVSLTKIETKR